MISSQKIYNNIYIYYLRHICDGESAQYITEILHNTQRGFVTIVQIKKVQKQIHNICRSFHQYFQKFLIVKNSKTYQL